MRPSVTATWGWDQGVQDRLFERDFEATNRVLLIIDGERAGTMRVVSDEAGLFVADIQIHPDHQSKGIGTQLLMDVIDLARLSGQSVHLRVLRTNRARGLYARLGFQVSNVTDTHIEMIIQPPSSRLTMRLP